MPALLSLDQAILSQDSFVYTGHYPVRSYWHELITSRFKHTGHYPVRSYWHELITSRFKHVLLITLIIKFLSACWVKHCARCFTRHRVFNLWANSKFAIAMPRMKYLKGSLRCNFIACNVARENAPCTRTSLSYQLHSPGFRFSKVLVTFSRPTQMTNQYINLRLASSPHPLEGNTSWLESSFTLYNS